MAISDVATGWRMAGPDRPPLGVPRTAGSGSGPRRTSLSGPSISVLRRPGARRLARDAAARGGRRLRRIDGDERSRLDAVLTAGDDLLAGLDPLGHHGRGFVLARKPHLA